MKGNKVVVTGMGAVTPLGLDVDSSWAGIRDGRSGAAAIEQFDAAAFSTRFSASVKNFSIDGYLEARDARRMDPFIQYGMVAGIQAFRDSGFEVTEANAARVGCAIGSGIGGIGSIEDTAMLVEQKGPKRISPFFVPGAIINMIAGNLSILYNLQGPNIAVVTACTTGTHNIGLGARMIAAGDVDAMLVGGAEMATTPVGIGGFAAARALSTRNDDPERASRPWDADRDGFVLGERGRVSHDVTPRGWSRRSGIDAAGTERCRSIERGYRLRECARHLDGSGGSGRVAGSEKCFRRPRVRAGGQLDKIHDRASAGCSGFGRSDPDDSGAAG